jgi:hypothetical protein
MPLSRFIALSLAVAALATRTLEEIAEEAQQQSLGLPAGDVGSSLQLAGKGGGRSSGGGDMTDDMDLNPDGTLDTSVLSSSNYGKNVPFTLGAGAMMACVFASVVMLMIGCGMSFMGVVIRRKAPSHAVLEVTTTATPATLGIEVVQTASL